MVRRTLRGMVRKRRVVEVRLICFDNDADVLLMIMMIMVDTENDDNDGK